MHITVWPPSLIHIWPLVGGQNDRETPDLVGAGGGRRRDVVNKSAKVAERERETVCQERRENNGRREKTSQKV